MEVHVRQAKPLQIGNPVLRNREPASCNKRNKQFFAWRLQTKHTNTGLQTEPATHMFSLGIYFGQLSVSFWGFSLQWSVVSYLSRTDTVLLDLFQLVMVPCLSMLCSKWACSCRCAPSLVAGFKYVSFVQEDFGSKLSATFVHQRVREGPDFRTSHGWSCQTLPAQKW